MDRRDPTKHSRRSLLQIAAAAAAGLAAGALPRALHAQGSAPRPLKIGVIGSGRIGGTVGELWVKAGHQVMFSSL
ncbi:MAG: NAD(P)-binding domain-containing protein, partial [Burkholderiales bacterium]